MLSSSIGLGDLFGQKEWRGLPDGCDARRSAPSQHQKVGELTHTITGGLVASSRHTGRLYRRVSQREGDEMNWLARDRRLMQARARGSPTVQDDHL